MQRISIVGTGYVGLSTAVYVIDGQSTDKTREIAVARGAQVKPEERQGKGSAIQAAFKSITGYVQNTR